MLHAIIVDNINNSINNQEAIDNSCSILPAGIIFVVLGPNGREKTTAIINVWYRLHMDRYAAVNRRSYVPLIIGLYFYRKKLD